MEWKRSFAVAVALPYLFDGSERLLHNNSLRSGPNERKPKAETGASAKIERGERRRAAVASLLVGAPLKNSGGATLSLYRRPGSLVVHRRRRLNIISCPYRLLPIAGRRRRGRRLLPLRLLPLRSTEREI